MATEILASGTTTAESTEILLAAGDTATVLLRRDRTINQSDACLALIQAEDSDSAWRSIGQLDLNRNCMVIEGPGNFRVQRQAGAVAFAVDQL